MTFDKNKLLKIINLLMFLDFLVLAASGFILKFIYPAGEKSGQAGIIFLLDRFGWLNVHGIVAFSFLALLLLHLMLNWAWIKNVFKRKNQEAM